MRILDENLIAIATAEILAGKKRTAAELHSFLYQLVLDCALPPPRAQFLSARRQPLANEVLPRHQRATWARGKTAYDTDEP